MLARDSRAGFPEVVSCVKVRGCDRHDVHGRLAPGRDAEHAFAGARRSPRGDRGNAGLRFVAATCLKYRRQAPFQRLVGQASNRHHSKFALYEPDEFEDAPATFKAAVERRFAQIVEWYDENILIQAARDDG